MQQRSPVRIKIGTLRLNGVRPSPRGHEDTPNEFPFCLACHFHSLKYSEVTISVCFNEALNDDAQLEVTASVRASSKNCKFLHADPRVTLNLVLRA